ncbi:MAG TPA: PAS domain S-box protein [Candidatus Angelobacter sp.]|nr:PAS domain S-box protein [Candidatus Angelobacter sp.]
MKPDSSFWARVSGSMLGRYAIALGVTAVGLLARWLLDPVLGDFAKHATLYPGIAFLALYIGLGPSVAATILGLMGITYWFVPPRGSFNVLDAAQTYSNLAFLTACICIIVLGEMSRRSRAQLQRAETLFKTFLDNCPGTEFLKDEKGRYVYANKTITGYFGETVIGKTDTEIVPGHYAEQWRSNDLKVLKGNKAHEFIETSPGKKGERTWLSAKFPLVDAEGRKLLGGMSLDITEQKRVEEELRTSEERLRLAQISGNVGVWDWDVKEDRVRWTPELEALFGLEPGTVRTYDDFSTRVHPEDLAMVEHNRDEALHKREPFEMEFRIIHASGKIRWVAAKGRGFYDETGQLVRVLGNNIDITERKQAEEEIRAASARLRHFVEAVPTGLTRCSRDLRYLMVNPAYAKMAGLPVEQITGRSIVDVMGAESWERIRPYVERVLGGERVEYEIPLPFAGRDTAYVHVAYTPERDSSGEVVAWVASVTDITEFKRVEAQLQKVEKRAAAGQLAASLAHEINNPLSAVTNALYLLNTSSGLDATASSLANTAASELERVARIVRQSLAYHRVGTTAREVDLGASVEESLHIYGEKFRRAGIHVRKKITPKALMTGFPDEIRQVIDNLLLNSLEATPSGGRLAVAVHWSQDWKKEGRAGVRLTIADSGQGISKEQLAMIFEPFFTTKAERGTGLGLWVVQGVVAKHDGSMKLRSSTREGKSGTVVSILWPASRWDDRERGMTRSQSAA